MCVYICAPFERNGSIAQLVQSICLTSRGSQVRILLLPRRNRHPAIFFCPMNTTSVTIRNELFELHPLKALWWPKHNMLVCADIHIGKGAHFRQAGIPIPKAVNASNLWNLVTVIQQFKPSQLVFLGDLFHSRINPEWEDLADCLAQFPEVHFVLVKGNHEIELNETYHRLGFEVTEQFELGDFLFMHEPAKQLTHKYVISGHIHPAVRLSGSAQQHLRLPCYWFGSSQCILPAFGEFTGMHTVQPKKGDQVFVVAENQIVQL
jgi:DNA ligase-associated metallophosphoesterase